MVPILSIILREDPFILSIQAFAALFAGDMNGNGLGKSSRSGKISANGKKGESRIFLIGKTIRSIKVR